MKQEALIVGAGPTGFVLALRLNRLGVQVRIIDKARESGTTSRAMIVHARTLEFYRRLGIADTIIAAGEKAGLLEAHLNRRVTARIQFGDFGAGLSRFPFMLILPQDVHEHLQEAELETACVAVERNCELAGIDQTNDCHRARLRTARGEEDVEFEYLCGCDGAHSAVRQQLGIGFPGETYDQVFSGAPRRARSPCGCKSHPGNGRLAR